MANAEKLAVVGAFEVDRLGKLLAQIKDLTEQAEAIKDDLKNSGFDVVEGALFRASVVAVDRVSLDAEKVRLLLGDKVALCEKVSHSVSVRVVSR